MPNYVLTARPQRRAPLARRVPRKAVARPVVRTARPTIRPFAPPNLDALSFPADIQGNPYVDYSRRLTAEGGVLILYKDLDLRIRVFIWRSLAWVAFTGFETWLLLWSSPVQARWINESCLFLMAALNLLILWKPPEISRSMEIRPDSMVLDGKDVFWLRSMENGLPEFQPDKDGNMVMSGIYGTRRVEYLTAHRLDDSDRTGEVLAAHVKEAMQQLWLPPERSPRPGNSPGRY
jgi:hypothetical protein